MQTTAEIETWATEWILDNVLGIVHAGDPVVREECRPQARERAVQLMEVCEQDFWHQLAEKVEP